MEATDSNPDGNAALINSFCEITSSSKQEALFFLESHNFDLDAAVSTFLDNSNTNTLNDAVTNVVPRSPSHSPDFQPSASPSPSRSRSTSPTSSRAPYQLRSRRTLGKDVKKPSGSRAGGIRTLADLKSSSRNGNDDDDDDDEDDSDYEPQEYYTGGEKSGMLVQDPTKDNSVDDIFDHARQSAVDVPPENPQRSKSFTGTARLLSGETVPSAPQPVEAITHTITFWRNGFSVDDGPLQGLDDPQNAPFLESLRKSECPKELEPADQRTSVHVNLTRRDENFPEPAKPRHLPFRGIGRTLGSSSSSSEAAGETIQATDVPLNTAPVPAIGLVVDDSQPVTSLQLRLSDGTRMVSRFNRHHTIRDVRAFIDASRPDGARSYQLQTMGFPPKQLTDWDQTIEQAGIANSVIIQKV
ncbi:PREDICTED: plant UBX domain-containing protein 4 [Lupinus angustifolius]|uniref:plant UBX domain-containing protein 4 n=1 Tax=Lupinus angustifolius TaxID=3871 RepID=UPI00092ED0DB|nr:PREDICTED: plant UBX domain-containing protein 4 [Lupinus angustifolius]